MIGTTLQDWEDAEAAHDSRVQTAATVMLCLRFSEAARVEALRAEEQLLRSQRRAEAARAYLERTSTTLEQAIRLHSLNRR